MARPAVVRHMHAAWCRFELVIIILANVSNLVYPIYEYVFKHFFPDFQRFLKDFENIQRIN